MLNEIRFLATGCFIISHFASIFTLAGPLGVANPLNGQHLRVIWPNWAGNPRGLSGPLKGKVILDYLMARFNFTSNFVRVGENWLEPTANGTRGQFTYLWNNEADLLIAGVLPTSDRLKTVDLTSVYMYDAVSILIPVSDDKYSNASAVIKPFQWPVWLSLFLSTVIVAYIFKKVQCLVLRHVNKSPKQPNERRNGMKLTNPYLYIFGNILSQGGTFTQNRLPIRLVAGVWSMAAFVFVQAYTATLITHILASSNKPLVDSFKDLAGEADVNILLRKFASLESMIMTTNSSEFFSKLKEKTDKFGCILESECVRQVKPGYKNVFLETKVFLIDHIRNRYKETKKCDIQIVDYGMFTVIPCFALPKNSPYTSTLSMGITQLREIGVIDFWDSWFRPIPPQCSANVKGLAEKEANKRNILRRLSVKNLTGAFTVLLAGIVLSFIFFLYELFPTVCVVIWP